MAFWWKRAQKAVPIRIPEIEVVFWWCVSEQRWDRHFFFFSNKRSTNRITSGLVTSLSQVTQRHCRFYVWHRLTAGSLGFIFKIWIFNPFFVEYSVWEQFFTAPSSSRRSQKTIIHTNSALFPAFRGKCLFRDFRSTFGGCRRVK